MMIVFHDGPQFLETQGQGIIERGVPREMDNQYAYSLIDSGQALPADDDALLQFQLMREERNG